MSLPNVMKTVWSYGGGVQSCGIGALIVEGRIPVPDFACIADTGREPETTWSYLREVVQPAMDKVGLKIHVIPHSFEEKGYNYVDLYGGKDKQTLLIPAHSNLPKNGKPSKSMLRGFCSNEWKRDPVRRFLRENGITRADMIIGFSTDEAQRMKVYDKTKPWNQIYPLWDLRLSRGDLIALIERMGWPPPPRSSCWMCPYRHDGEWRDLSKQDFNKAVEFEKEIRATKDEHVFLHKSMQTLDKVDFTKEPDLFDKPCDSGFCFT